MRARCCPAAIALALVGCRPTPVVPPDDVAAAPRVEERAGPARDDAFLRLDVDLDATYPLRARIVRAGPVYPQHDGRPAADGDGRTMVRDVTVLDADARGDPLRPRVLCTGPDHRVAVHLDVDDLAIVARTGAVMSATPQRRDAWPDTMPGIRFAAGTRLRIEGGLHLEIVRAVLETPTMRAAGFVEGKHIGYTWVPDAWAEPFGVADARVRQAVALLATPGGAELARLDPRMAAAGLFVRRLGPEQSGHVLVRLDEPGASAVGWIAATELEPGSGPALGGVRMIGRGGGQPGDPVVELAPGTVLLGGALRDPIGVVTATAAFHCVDACESSAPVVEVDACTRTITVWTAKP